MNLDVGEKEGTTEVNKTHRNNCFRTLKMSTLIEHIEIWFIRLTVFFIPLACRSSKQETNKNLAEIDI